MVFDIEKMQMKATDVPNVEQAMINIFKIND